MSAAVTWTDATSFWDIATNWSSNPSLPGPLDDVTIDVGGTHTITVRSTGGPFTINSLSMPGDETLTITGNTLTVSGAFANSAATTMTGGTLVLNGASTMASLTQIGQISGTGNLSITGTADIANGGHAGAATTTVQGTTTISGVGLRLDGGRIFRNEGTVNQTTGDVNLNSRQSGTAEPGNGSVVNAATGTWNVNPGAGNNFILASNQGVGDTGAGATFTNQGTFNKLGAGTTDVRVAFVNDGTIDVQVGTLQFSTGGTLTHNDTLTIAAGARLNLVSGAVTHTFNTAASTIAGTLEISGNDFVNFTQAHTLSGTGTFQNSFGQVIGSNLTLGPSLTFNVGTAGHSGSATTTAQGTTNITGTFALDGGRIFRNEGTVNQTTGDVNLNSRRSGTAEPGNGAVVNAPTGTWNANPGAGTHFLLASSQGVGDTGAGATFTNQGTFNKLGTGTTDVRVGFVNDGTTNVQAGTLTINVGGTLQNPGVVNIHAGELRLATAFTNDGTINVSSGAELQSTNLSFTNAGMLAGGGTVTAAINGALLNDGSILPGDGIGNLQIAGDLTQSDSGILQFALASLASFDTLTVTDDVALDGKIVVENMGYVPVVGDSFVVLSFDERLGGSQFDSIMTMGYGAGVVFTAIYNPNDVTLTVAAVPEPETWAMLLVGLGVVGFAVRRRRAGTKLQLPC